MSPETVKRVRRRLGLSQAELAELLGVHEMTVSKWERGVVEPSTMAQELIRIALTRRGLVLKGGRVKERQD